MSVVLARPRAVSLAATALLAALLAAVLVLVPAPTARAADESALPSTSGTDFWVAFTRNANPPEFSLKITGEVDTSGEITWPDGSTEPFSVVANDITTVTAPSSYVTSANTFALDTVSSELGIRIESLERVTVYGLNYGASSSDAFIAIPTGALGTDYRVMSYATTIPSFPSRAVVMAAVDGTTVTITPSETMSGRAADVPYEVTLDAGEVYSIGEATAGADVTGTHISSDKVVAVYGAVDCVNVISGACDTVVQQMFPTETWGTDFVAAAFPGTLQATAIRVLAKDDATEVTVDGAVVGTLDAGEFWEGTIASTTGNDAVAVSGSGPISVGTFMSGGNRYGSTSETGDPAFVLLNSTDQYLASYTLGTPGSGFGFNGITVVVPTSAIDSFTLDGATIAQDEWSEVAGTDYSTAAVEVSAGTHNVTASAPFGALAYGANAANSYGYVGGSALSAVGEIGDMDLRTPAQMTAYVGTEVCVASSVVDGEGQPLSGVRVNAITEGVNGGIGLTAATINSGSAMLCYEGTNVGVDTVTATAGGVTSVTEVTWLPYEDVEPLTVLDPEDVTLFPNETAFFEAFASGAPTPTIQWQRSTDGGDTWTDIVDATDRTLSFTATAADDGHQFRAVATNSEGSATSGPATLTVVERIAPVFVTDPVDATVGPGATATFSVDVRGAETVAWETSTDGGDTWSVISGATGASYTTDALALADSGQQYRAVATNAYGTVTSAAATATVELAAPTVTSPEDADVTEGETATFSVEATDADAIQWQVSTDGGETWVDVEGATSESYTTDATTLADDGSRFRAAATNEGGTTYSDAAVLSVTVPAPTVTDPDDAAVTEGGTATFTVEATGADTIQWQVSTDGGITWVDVDGATEASYTTAALMLADHGSLYRAAVTNAAGTTFSDEAVLSVTVASVDPEEPGAGEEPGTDEGPDTDSGAEEGTDPDAAGEELSTTGADVLGAIGAAAVLMSLGLVAIVAVRRRRAEG